MTGALDHMSHPVEFDPRYIAFKQDVDAMCDFINELAGENPDIAFETIQARAKIGELMFWVSNAMAQTYQADQKIQPEKGASSH